MKDGICPKCRSSEVYKKKTVGTTSLVLSWFRASDPVNYVCADCGYVEWYLDSRKDLDHIRDNWPKATNEKRKR